MKNTKIKPKLLVILGPTASGKTDLAILLAKKFNGELVSADSRTIYKGMDIGTGKDKTFPCAMLDVVSPDKTLTLSQYKQKAVKAINAIIAKGKLPILVGGTGLYIWSIVDNLLVPKVPANIALRNQLEKKTVDQLYKMLLAVDENSAKVTGLNKRRIIRALEVITTTGEKFSQSAKKGEPLYDVLQLGIAVRREVLVERINKRVDGMIENGFMNEVMDLRKKLYAPELPAMSGIGYAELNTVIDGGQSLAEAVERIKSRTRQYARRQMTWFKRDPRIHWVLNNTEAENMVKKWNI